MLQFQAINNISNIIITSVFPKTPGVRGDLTALDEVRGDFLIRGDFHF